MGQAVSTCTAKVVPGPFPWLGQSSLSARTAQRWQTLLDTTSAPRDLLTGPGPTCAELARVHTRVLAIFGDRSDFLPSWRGLQRHLPRCRPVIVPAAGHFHPRRRPDVFIREVRAFLAEVDGRGEGRP